MKLLATGDLHFSAGMDRLGPWRLDDQEQVWRRICDLALEESVDAVLLAGDIFDRPRPSPEVLRAFLRSLRFLRAAGVDVLAITGNAGHDIVNADVACALEIFDDLMDVRRQPGLWSGRGLQVACLPSVPVHRLVASQNGGDRDALNELAAAHLLNVARGLRAQCEGPAVLLAHWSVTGASLPSGLPIEMAHEPILDLGELEAMGWDAIVLGHIHKPQLLGSEDAPGPIFYVGSPMPLSFGEPGEHGVWLFDSEPVLSAAHPTSYRFVPIQSRAFVTLEADFTDDSVYRDPIVVTDALFAESTRPAIDDAVVRFAYRVTEEQARRIDGNWLRATFADAGAKKFEPQPEIVRETRARVEGIDETLNEKQAFALWLDAEGVDERLQAKLSERHAQMLEEVAT